MLWKIGIKEHTGKTKFVVETPDGEIRLVDKYTDSVTFTDDNVVAAMKKVADIYNPPYICVQPL